MTEVVGMAVLLFGLSLVRFCVVGGLLMITLLIAAIMGSLAAIAVALARVRA